jgi:hypothetical protein
MASLVGAPGVSAEHASKNIGPDDAATVPRNLAFAPQISRTCPEQRGPAVLSIQDAARAPPSATNRAGHRLIPPEDIRST